MLEERIADFIRETGEKPPLVKHLSVDECERIRTTLCKRLQIPMNTTGVALVKERCRKQVLRADHGGCETPISIRPALDDIHVIPSSYIYANWGHFNNIDRFESEFVIQHLADLIYPGGDYVDLFDESVAWIVSVDYECRVRTFVAAGSL